MGEIVAAFGVCHSPHLLTRPPDENPEHQELSIKAMRELGKVLDETKPDVILFLGSDHLETFSVTCVPTFAIIAGNRVIAKHAGFHYNLPNNRSMAESLLDKLIRANFDVAYSEDAILGHTFAVPFEYVLENRKIPVVPFFTNVYLPPLPSMQRCADLGREIRKIIKSRKERVAVIASGGMSHYPGTSKYEYPEFNFDYWMISQMEIGNTEAILNLTPEQLDETGNTEMLTWAIMLGMIGFAPGELIQYTPTWHHGHGYMRFLPQRERRTPPRRIKEEYGGFKFKNKGFEFYKAPPASAARLNKLLFDMRLSTSLCERIVENPDAVAAEYGLTREQRKLAQNFVDVGTTSKVSKFVPPFVAVGVHPLLALMGLHAIYPVAKALQSRNGKSSSQRSAKAQKAS
jgi:aromatic ring-opening dioxygenase catalytic subunit (LigB family)